MFVAGRYKIGNDYKVHNLICASHPNGDYIYDPFANKEVLPFWGVLCTTFWGLDGANREYLIKNSSQEEIENLQFKKFWVFWFVDGDMDDQKEMFFHGEYAKEKALSIQQIFNSLLERQVDKVLVDAREYYKNNKLGSLGNITITELQEQMKEEK